MTEETSMELICDLDRLLDQERKALMKGDLESIGALTTRKEELVSRINNLDLAPGDDLLSVHEKVTRNQALLNSALDGIRAVAKRMSDLRKVRASLEIYDESGRKKTFGSNVASSVEKRA